jgi:hypothetical protein
MSIFWRIAVFLLAASFLAENMGFFTHQMNLAIGLLCLVAFIMLYFPSIKFKKTKIDWRLAVIGLVILALAIVLLRGEILLRMAGLCVFLAGFDVFLRSLNRQESELPVLLVTLLGFTLFIAVYQYTPFLWYPMNSFSLSISKMVSFFTHKDVLLSITFTGLWSSILFAWFFISSYLFSAEKKAWHLPVFLVSLLFANVVYVVLFAYLPSLLRFFLPLVGIKDIQPGAPIPERYFFNLPIILFLLLLVPLLLHVRKTRYQAMSLMPKKADIKMLIPCLVLLALSVSSLAISFPVKFVPDREVVFYEKGFLNWLTPSFKSFGSASAGMFGNLPAFVDKMGLKSRRISEVTKESLAGAKVLVLININKEIPQSEIDTIWDFVTDGGSLLMLGDHTWYKDKQKNWLNEILKPANIEYNFDSADFFIGGWLHSYEYAAHPITHNIGDEENEAGIVVGASLKTKYPAVPLIMGRYGYSDTGNLLNPDHGYIGNFEYDMSEQLGDLVLAAQQRYGKGKVLVFGDTSGFVNAILVDSYPFINRVFNWLASDSMPEPYPLRLALCLVFLAGAVVLFLRTNRNMATLFFGALVIVLIVVSAGFASSWKIERPITGNIAYVDASHFERYSKESWRDDGIMGLNLNLMRNGYLPFQLRDFSPQKIADSDLLVLVAPTEPFSKGEVETLKTYVQNGGFLILTVGWEERNASLPIVEAFNFRLSDAHLGYFKVKVPGTNEMAMFWEAWPVYSNDDKAEEICSTREYPLIAMRDYGKGKFVIIGDSNFFLNKNLEMDKQPYMDNINFLKWLLTKLAASQVTKGG